MAPELESNIEVAENNSGSPEEINAVTRNRVGRVLIKVGKIGSGLGLVLLAVSGCVGGEDEVEQRRAGLWNQTNAALCTKKAANPNPAGGVINNIETAEDQLVDNGPIDLSKLPTALRKQIWKQFVFEKEQNLMAQGQPIVYKIFLYSEGGEKGEAIGQLTHMTGVSGMQFITPEGFVKSGSKIYQLQEIDGSVQDIEIGEITITGPSTHKDGIFLIKHIEGNTIRKLAAIDPANPDQVLKDIIIPSGESLIGESGMDFDPSTNTLSVAVENKIHIYKNLPEGIDWMDNADDYLEYIEVVGNYVQEIHVISGYTFAVNPSEIIVISPVGQIHTTTSTDINSPMFQSFEKIGGRLHIVSMPSFSVAPWPNPLNPDFPYLIIPDPGADSSNYTYCTAFTPELYSAVFPTVNPDTDDEDVYIYDVLEEIGVDTEIYTDIDPEDIIDPLDEITPPPDTTPEDIIDPLDEITPPPDTTPEDVIEPLDEIELPDEITPPPDTTPPDIIIPPDIPIIPDIEEDLPKDLIQETFDNLIDFFADSQFEQIEPEEIIKKDDKTTPDTTPDLSQQEDTGDDFAAEPDAFVEEEHHQKVGKSCSTAPDGTPMTPGETARTTAALVLAAAGLALARRRKEEEAE